MGEEKKRGFTVEYETELLSYYLSYVKAMGQWQPMAAVKAGNNQAQHSRPSTHPPDKCFLCHVEAATLTELSN